MCVQIGVRAVVAHHRDRFFVPTGPEYLLGGEEENAFALGYIQHT